MAGARTSCCRIRRTRCWRSCPRSGGWSSGCSSISSATCTSFQIFRAGYLASLSTVWWFMSQLRSRAVAYVTLPHFTPLATVVAVTGLLAWLIAGSSVAARDLGGMLLAMLGGQIVVGVANELVDAENDRLTKPSKPIPAGLVSRRGAMALGLAGLVLMVAAGVTLGAASLLILLAGTGAGVVYSL